MSKRKLKILVDEKFVNGWNDPRMPTISGMRRRGYTPTSIRKFIDKTGVVKRNGITDISLLEHTLREELNISSKRVMAVLDPLKIIITNYPENKVEELEAINNPENSSDGFRKLPFSREIYIERTDFFENPPKKYFRLSPGKEVRLLHAYYITCTKVIKKNNKISELHCKYDIKSKGGWTKDGRKVKGTIHWVSVEHALNAQINIYNRLFTKENPFDSSEFTDSINPNSLQIIYNAKVEPSLGKKNINENFQFIRTGYFVLDELSKAQKLIFNQSVALRDSWAKINKNV